MDFGLFGIGTWELIVIGLIALLVLGPRQMIILARKAGELLRQFQAIWHQTTQTIDREIKAIEAEGESLTGLAQDLNAVADNLKSIGNINLMGNGRSLAPPNSAPPAPPAAPGATAPPSETTNAPATAAPAANPQPPAAQPDPKYATWKSTPQN